ncbi:hypothetical protein C0J52_21296 [Blattella germanica]|nr:hypothetical protein C0J52_21296 [Blattella germanica]
MWCLRLCMITKGIKGDKFSGSWASMPKKDNRKRIKEIKRKKVFDLIQMLQIEDLRDTDTRIKACHKYSLITDGDLHLGVTPELVKLLEELEFAEAEKKYIIDAVNEILQKTFTNLGDFEELEKMPPRERLIE